MSESNGKKRHRSMGRIVVQTHESGIWGDVMGQPEHETVDAARKWVKDWVAQNTEERQGDFRIIRDVERFSLKVKTVVEIEAS
jgi:hypothetical protein